MGSYLGGGVREGAIAAEQTKSWPGLAPASAKTKSLNWALGITEQGGLSLEELAL